MKDRLRNLRLAVVLTTLRVVLRALSRVVPQSRSVVVAAFPETEGNGVETARALLRRYPGTVVWMREAGELPRDVAALVEEGLVLVPKASLAGLWAYLRAEAVLFTHGLYGSPRPVRRKPVVNLWHGDGPKDIRPGKNVGAEILSTYLVGSSALFSRFKAEANGVPGEDVLLTGNPRTDQFWREPDTESLAALGIRGPFVLWMPTFRRPGAVGATRTDASLAGGSFAEGPEVDALRAGLAARGIQLVVKPHPMDSEQPAGTGMVVVTDADLRRAGVTLYELLGASTGLVTDYSSVWVDYLLLDRPMAFHVHDRGTYQRALFPADVLDWVPGEVVDPTAPQPFERFLADLDARGQEDSEVRRAVVDRIGLVTSQTSADDLVEALAARGIIRL